MSDYYGRRTPIIRSFEELTVLNNRPASEANEIRSEAYQDMYEKLPSQEKMLADRKKQELKDMMPDARLGDVGAWELLVSLGQALEFADWPERGG